MYSKLPRFFSVLGLCAILSFGAFLAPLQAKSIQSETETYVSNIDQTTDASMLAASVSKEMLNLMASCSQVNISSVLISSVTSTGATISWPNTGAVSYFVRFRAVGSSTYSQANLPAGFTSLVLSTLSPCTTYEYRIFARCSNGRIKGSRIGRFTTSGC